MDRPTNLAIVYDYDCLALLVHILCLRRLILGSHGGLHRLCLSRLMLEPTLHCCSLDPDSSPFSSDILHELCTRRTKQRQNTCGLGPQRKESIPVLCNERRHTHPAAGGESISREKPPPLLTVDSAFTYFPDIHLPDPPENIRGLLDDLHKYRIKLA